MLGQLSVVDVKIKTKIFVFNLFLKAILKSIKKQNPNLAAKRKGEFFKSNYEIGH